MSCRSRVLRLYWESAAPAKLLVGPQLDVHKQWALIALPKKELGRSLVLPVLHVEINYSSLDFLKTAFCDTQKAGTGFLAVLLNKVFSLPELSL